MNVYDEAVRAVPNSEKMAMYEIYIARAAELFGVPRTRQIYEVSELSSFPWACDCCLMAWNCCIISYVLRFSFVSMNHCS